VKIILPLLAGGLLLSLTAAAQAQLEGIDPRTGKPAEPVVKPLPQPAPKPVARDEGSTCGDYGTAVLFEESPKDAAARAKKEEKLVFVLHVSGNFEDPRFT
jgi:hypothetical protein